MPESKSFCTFAYYKNTSMCEGNHSHTNLVQHQVPQKIRVIQAHTKVPLQGDANRQKGDAYSDGNEMFPSSIIFWMVFGDSPSTVHPTDTHVPTTSFTVPENSLAWDLGLMVRAISQISAMVRFPSCFTFLTFLRSRAGSFNALMIKAAADGMTSTVA
mmetsp:Transcript_3480/g.13272  ORF Transcript_3480/g.13272 Transcript_3480/m.13272 type:complete len:158 (-) Transcript_3480:271-744(-)